MPRRNLRAPAGSRPASPRTLNERVEEFRGERYRVRSLAGNAAAGPYRCPGCDQLIGAGMPHIVAWSEYDVDATDRRHWHAACWAGRDRRRPAGRGAVRRRAW